MFKKPNEAEIARLINNFEENKQPIIDLLYFFNSTLKETTKLANAQKLKADELYMKLEKCMDGLEGRNKDYNKLKRFLLGLEQESDEEAEEVSVDTKHDIIDESLIGLLVKRVE